MESKMLPRLVVVSRVVAAAVAALIVTMDRPFAPGVVQASPMQSPAAEGIRVHGEWVIDVRQPDGTLVEHREFKNDLMQDGAGLLVGLLLGESTFGHWMVILTPADGFSPCRDEELGGGSACLLVEDLPGGVPDVGVFRTLIVRRATSADGKPAIQLIGTVRTTSAGQVGTVRTLAGSCASSVLQARCGQADVPGEPVIPYTNGDFTGTTVKNPSGVPAPISVAPEQTIDVKVTLSFS